MEATVVGRLDATLAPLRTGDVRATGARSGEVNDGATADESAPGSTVEGRIGRGAVRGALVGLVALGSFGAGIGVLTGVDPVGALAIGAFAGIWGGPGFGGMLGATLAYTHATRR